MEINKLIEKAKEIKEKYALINKKQWTASEYAQGLIIDASDLMRLMMVKDGFRKNRTDDLDQKTKKELCECLWSVLIIADELGVNLENDFIEHVDILKERIDKEGY